MLEYPINILESTSLSYKFAIILGLILIIAAVCPPLIAAVVKQSITLTGRQAQALGAIGLILILTGSVGQYMANKHPIINEIHPEENTHTVGDIIIITVRASDPNDDDLRYEFWRMGPATGNMWYPVKGPVSNNSWCWDITSADKGLNYIKVIVYDEEDLNCSTKTEYKIRPPNQPPEITNISATTLDGSIWKLETNASDDDGDEIEYKFSKFNSVSQSWDIIRNWSTEDECYWNRSGNDASKKLIRVDVRDCFHKYLIGDIGDAKMTLELDEIKANDSDEKLNADSDNNSSGDTRSPDSSTDVGDNMTGGEI